MALEKVGALWLKEKKDGRGYFSGMVGEMRVVAFENDYKEEEKHPDYLIYKSTDDETQTREPEKTQPVKPSFTKGGKRPFKVGFNRKGA